MGRCSELETPACVQKDVDGEGGPVPYAPRHLRRHRSTSAARTARMACSGTVQRSGKVHSCSLGNCKFCPVRSRPSQTRALPPEREHCARHTGSSGSAHQVECATHEHFLRRVVMPDWVCAYHYNARPTCARGHTYPSHHLRFIVVCRLVPRAEAHESAR